MAATAVGNVYTWGYGRYGALGLNDEDNKMVRASTRLDTISFERQRW